MSIKPYPTDLQMLTKEVRAMNNLLSSILLELRRIADSNLAIASGEL